MESSNWFDIELSPSHMIPEYVPDSYSSGSFKNVKTLYIDIIRLK